MYIKLQKVIMFGMMLSISVSCSKAPSIKNTAINSESLIQVLPKDVIGDQKLNIWLSSNQPSITLSKSPWGEGITLTVQKQYYSAAGKQCKLMRIQTLPNQALACRNGQGWQKIRSFN